MFEDEDKLFLNLSLVISIQKNVLFFFSSNIQKHLRVEKETVGNLMHPVTEKIILRFNFRASSKFITAVRLFTVTVNLPDFPKIYSLRNRKSCSRRTRDFVANSNFKEERAHFGHVHFKKPD